MIDHQQIETPEWSTEELKSLVEWEQIKTRLWFLLTSPIMTKFRITKQIFVRPRKAFNFVKFVLSSVITRAFRRLLPVA